MTAVAVAGGDYDLAESDGPADYTAGAWSCAGGSQAGSTVTVAADADVTCTITNAYTPPPGPTGTVTLVKQVDNTGGGIARPREWTLTAEGPQTVTGAGNSHHVTGVVVTPGDYTLSESNGPAHYAPGSWSCTGGTVTGDVVTVTASADVTCTITNTYTPAPVSTGALTLVKHVDNAGGGLATPDQWTLTAEGPQSVSGAANSPQVTDVPVAPGDYVLDESGSPADYAAGSWSCAGGALDGSTVTVDAGSTVRCEITNTYRLPPSPPAGTITLLKRVDNSGGGTALATEWALTADGPQRVTGTAGSAAVTNVVVAAGVYTLSESGGPGGYQADGWRCTGGTQSGASITIDANALVTCELTNRFRAATHSPSATASSGSGGAAPVGASTSSEGDVGLAATGSDLAPSIALGLLLILAGTALLGAGIRRTSRGRRLH